MNIKYKNLINSFDFKLREKIKFSRGKYYAGNQSKKNLFKHLKGDKRNLAEIKEQEFLEKYHLHRLKNDSTRRNYLENLYTIDLLENFLNLSEAEKDINILDIGSKNWFYVQGEYHFFKYNNSERNICLSGIELDPYRLYIDFHSRYDYAKYHMRNLENTEYLIGNLLDHHGEYDYITWILPFVTQEALLSWGLPLEYFKPRAMLLRAFNLLKPGGKLIVVNQGEEESLIQANLEKHLRIPPADKKIFESIFLKYKFRRYVSVLEKKGFSVNIQTSDHKTRVL